MKFLNLLMLFGVILNINCSKKITAGTGKHHHDNNSTALTVMSYNIHHANPPTKPNVIDLNAIANVIKQQQPDVVALQEVDVNTSRSGSALNEAEQLATLTGMKAYFAKAIDYSGGEYGVAILSKFPMENMKNIALPTNETTNGEHRTLAIATLTLPGNKKIVFTCTHFDAQRSDTNRQLQIKKVLELLKEETLPVIIAGDLNSEPNSSVISQLDSYFSRSCINGCPFTIPEKNPNKTIDYIAYAPRARFIVLSHKVVDEEYASDHRPVVATLELK